LGLAGAAHEDEAAEGEAEPERADGEGADRDALAPHRHLLPAADRLALLLGQLLPAPLLAQRAAGLESDIEVVDGLGSVVHAAECIASFGSCPLRQARHPSSPPSTWTARSRRATA